jgi:hypothetical protein
MIIEMTLADVPANVTLTVKTKTGNATIEFNCKEAEYLQKAIDVLGMSSKVELAAIGLTPADFEGR